MQNPIQKVCNWCIKMNRLNECNVLVSKNSRRRACGYCNKAKKWRSLIGDGKQKSHPICHSSARPCCSSWPQTPKWKPKATTPNSTKTRMASKTNSAKAGPSRSSSQAAKSQVPNTMSKYILSLYMYRSSFSLIIATSTLSNHSPPPESCPIVLPPPSKYLIYLCGHLNLGWSNPPIYPSVPVLSPDFELPPLSMLPASWSSVMRIHPFSLFNTGARCGATIYPKHQSPHGRGFECWQCYEGFQETMQAVVELGSSNPTNVEGGEIKDLEMKLHKLFSWKAP